MSMCLSEMGPERSPSGVYAKYQNLCNTLGVADGLEHTSDLEAWVIGFRDMEIDAFRRYNDNLVEQIF